MFSFLNKKFFAVFIAVLFFVFVLNIGIAEACQVNSDCPDGYECIITPPLAEGSCVPLSQSPTQGSITSSQTGAFLGTAGFSQSASAEHIVATIIKTVLSLLAVLFVVLIIFSGFQWMTAGGNEEQVKKAQARIKNAVIGLIIIVFAYAITSFVFNNLITPPTTGSPGTSN
jgi:hypothetical protein